MSIAHTMLKTLNSSKVLGAFAIYSGASFLKTGISGAMDSTEAFAGQDPAAWERAGYNAGSTMAEGAMFGTDLFWLHHFKERGAKGAMDNVFKRGDRFYQEHKGNLFRVEMSNSEKFGSVWKRGTQVTEASTANLIKKEGVAGMLGKNGGQFLKNLGARGMFASIAIPLAVGMVAPMALGFAGKIFDEAYNERRRMTEIHYDNRFFNTDKYDASTYQQLGAAMNSYQSKMVSMARVFHAR